MKVGYPVTSEYGYSVDGPKLANFHRRRDVEAGEDRAANPPFHAGDCDVLRAHGVLSTSPGSLGCICVILRMEWFRLDFVARRLPAGGIRRILVLTFVTLACILLSGLAVPGKTAKRYAFSCIWAAIEGHLSQMVTEGWFILSPGPCAAGHSGRQAGSI